MMSEQNEVAAEEATQLQLALHREIDQAQQLKLQLMYELAT